MSRQLKIAKNIIRDASGTMIVNSFPENTERIEASKEALGKLQYPLTAFPSYEVALLRVFFYADEWHISTSRKIDAFSSYWGSDKSFGRLFEEEVEMASDIREIGLDLFLQSLDKEIRYFFLLPLRGGQRCGAMRDAPQGTFWLAGIQQADSQNINLHPEIKENLWKTLPKVSVNSAAEFVKYISSNQNRDIELTGLMVCQEDKFTRFVTSDYYRRYTLRNNDSNVYKRWLEILKSEVEEDIVSFYNQHKTILKPFLVKIDDLVSYLHSKYIERYVKKEYQIISKRFHVLIKTFHEEYIKSNFSRITQDRVRDILIYKFPARFILNTLAELNH